VRHSPASDPIAIAHPSRKVMRALKVMRAPAIWEESVTPRSAEISQCSWARGRKPPCNHPGAFLSPPPSEPRIAPGVVAVIAGQPLPPKPRSAAESP
jgi:hypothetical protein